MTWKCQLRIYTSMKKIRVSQATGKNNRTWTNSQNDFSLLRIFAAYFPLISTFFFARKIQTIDPRGLQYDWNSFLQLVWQNFVCLFVLQRERKVRLMKMEILMSTYDERHWADVNSSKLMVLISHLLFYFNLKASSGSLSTGTQKDILTRITALERNVTKLQQGLVRSRVFLLTFWFCS